MTTRPRLFFAHSFKCEERRQRCRRIVETVAARNQLDVVYGDPRMLRGLLTPREQQVGQDFFSLLTKGIERSQHWIADISEFDEQGEPCGLNYNVILELGIAFNLAKGRVDVLCHETLRDTVRMSLSNLSGHSAAFLYYRNDQEFQAHIEDATGRALEVLSIKNPLLKLIRRPITTFPNGRFGFVASYPASWDAKYSVNGDGVRLSSVDLKGLDLRVWGSHFPKAGETEGPEVRGRNCVGRLVKDEVSGKVHTLRCAFGNEPWQAEVSVFLSGSPVRVRRFRPVFDWICGNLALLPAMRDEQIEVEAGGKRFQVRTRIFPDPNLMDGGHYGSVSIGEHGRQLLSLDVHGIPVPPRLREQNRSSSKYFLTLFSGGSTAFVCLFGYGACHPDRFVVIRLSAGGSEVILDKSLDVFDIEAGSLEDFRFSAVQAYSESICREPSIRTYDPQLVYRYSGQRLDVDLDATRGLNERVLGGYRGPQCSHEFFVVERDGRSEVLTAAEVRKIAAEARKSR